MPSKSTLPDIQCPDNIPVWTWLFESQHQPHQSSDHGHIKGPSSFTNAITGERLDYIALKQNAEFISTTLVRNHGLQADDTVALFSRNSVWYPVGMFAVLRAGGKVVGASPESSIREASSILRKSHARFVMTSPEAAKIVIAAARYVELPMARIFVLFDEVDGLVSIQQLAAIGKVRCQTDPVAPFKIPPQTTNRQVCGYLSFTSGTTGEPKACMISHHNIMAQCLQMRMITSPDVQSVLAVLPFYHITGLVHMIHLPILRGVDVVMLPRFTMDSMLNAVERYKIAELNLVPPLLIRMVNDPIVRQFDLTCIRRFVGGAAPLPSEFLKLLELKYPHTGFKQGYGMTESCSCISAHDPAHYDYKYARTCGVLLSNTEVKFVNENDNEVEEGEILARGPQCTMGYLGDSASTQATFDADGWLRTGDKGLLDSDGCLRITGRIKDLIKVKGVGVAPAELEDLLLEHPAVQDVAVVGISHPYSGEVPKAYVVLEGAFIPDRRLADILIRHVQERVTKSKWIAAVEFIKMIPRAASGKIQRKDLRGESQSMAMPKI